MTHHESLTGHPRALEWTLRVGAFLCFVGHGAFGIMTKEGWVRYFAVAGIGRHTAFTLMPLIGTLDVTMGFLVLVVPCPLVVYWMFAWAVWTASLRPLSGESFWEALERAGNYGVPAALLLLMVPVRRWADLVRPGRFRDLSPTVLLGIRRTLTLTVMLLMVGHGALGVIGKPGLVHNYASILPADVADALTPYVGWLEIVLAASLAVRQGPTLLVFIAVWKLATESLFVTAGAPAWEVVERGGSYAAPIALAIVILMSRGRAVAAETISPQPLHH